MMPYLISFGPLHISSLFVGSIVTWFLWSFVFWKRLRNLAFVDEVIFDMMFTMTIVSALSSRLLYVLLHPFLFSLDPIRIIAFWVVPGFSWYGILLGLVLTAVFLASKRKVFLSQVFDALALSLMVSLPVALIASFLDGVPVGHRVPPSFPFGVLYQTQVGARHPVQLYFILFILIVRLFLWIVEKKNKEKKLAHGVLALWFFGFIGFGLFCLEFFIENSVYWGSLSANQWFCIIIFAQTLGAFYVFGGGRQRLAILIETIQRIMKKVGGIVYAKFSKRNIR